MQAMELRSMHSYIKDTLWLLNNFLFTFEHRKLDLKRNKHRWVSQPKSNF